MASHHRGSTTYDAKLFLDALLRAVEELGQKLSVEDSCEEIVNEPAGGADVFWLFLGYRLRREMGHSDIAE